MPTSPWLVVFIVVLVGSLVAAGLIWFFGSGDVRRRRWWAIAILALIGGAYGVYDGILTLQRAYASRSWPTTQGWVISSRVERSSGRQLRGQHASVVYSYRVNGIPFRSAVVSFGDGEGGAYEIVGRYPQGAQVIVHYDPENPDIATLEPRTSWLNYFRIVVAVLIALGGVWGCRYLWKTRPGQTTETG